ncbi:universal stress protein [Spirosoma utsteinense]|uniref:Nucleotide-binding universal stress UspA family protein n=1 Tax=Spirosoma utsteinense TaxID=2585773 RepID=A0ABR6W9D4_9BACT|nr:universal stress protein [Spirosoma utsteinense]MBC3787594.1 nucleotide-binding universal stress UspA family protein [Spirosoma utsteinense]MBC3793190.1 nucleotide-binding universal stress UspA family protein [Spirosoma utsteinense]
MADPTHGPGIDYAAPLTINEALLMKTILIPIDFSALAQSTAHFGLELAQRMTARIVLLHVVQPSPPVPTFNVPVVELTAWNDTLQAQMAQALSHFQGEIGHYQRERGLTSVPISTRLVVGQPADCILDVAASEKASFIVMGTVGAANAWDKLIGSVASAVAQRADRPVWILPAAVPLDSLRRFAYFADMEGQELSCINQVMNLGERLRAKLEVVHVSPLLDEEFDVAESLVESFEDTYAPERITFHHLTFDSVPEGIETYVRSHQPDVIVLAHRNRGFVEKIFHKSLIRQLSLTTKRPLLIIPKKS